MLTYRFYNPLSSCTKTLASAFIYDTRLLQCNKQQTSSGILMLILSTQLTLNVEGMSVAYDTRRHTHILYIKTQINLQHVYTMAPMTQYVSTKVIWYSILNDTTQNLGRNKKRQQEGIICAQHFKRMQVHNTIQYIFAVLP